MFGVAGVLGVAPLPAAEGKGIAGVTNDGLPAAAIAIGGAAVCAGIAVIDAGEEAGGGVTGAAFGFVSDWAFGSEPLHAEVPMNITLASRTNLNSQVRFFTIEPPNLTLHLTPIVQTKSLRWECRSQTEEQ